MIRLDINRNFNGRKLNHKKDEKSVCTELNRNIERKIDIIARKLNVIGQKNVSILDGH